jgi:hypothetical protein
LPPLVCKSEGELAADLKDARTSLEYRQQHRQLVIGIAKGTAKELRFTKKFVTFLPAACSNLRTPERFPPHVIYSRALQ